MKNIEGNLIRLSSYIYSTKSTKLKFIAENLNLNIYGFLIVIAICRLMLMLFVFFFSKVYLYKN